MSGERCEGCDRSVSVAGGIANVWSFDGTRTGGMTLELDDGTEHFLCFQCIDELGIDPDADDVADLPRGPREAAGEDGRAEDASTPPIAIGLALGGAAGGAVAIGLGTELEPMLATGAALGIGVALLVGRLRPDA